MFLLHKITTQKPSSHHIKPLPLQQPLLKDHIFKNYEDDFAYTG